MRYIDSHSHVYFPQFDQDREAVFSRMREMDVQTIAVGTDFLNSRSAVQYAVDYPDVVLGATIGVHPTQSGEGFNEGRYGALIATYNSPGAPRVVVGVGECGLDYFRTPREEVYQEQRGVFEAQISFAVVHDLPLMLHIRPEKGGEQAHRDAQEILKQYQATHGSRVRGTAHFFTGSVSAAQGYWDRGFATSFPGVITFAPETHAVVRAAPKELLLAETDAPYAAPVPHRGARNEPPFVVAVVQAIAHLRGEELEETARYLVDNTQRIFNIR